MPKMISILIGIDDTDNPTSKGTGHLARLLLEECRRRGLRVEGVTRHQFLVDPRIPYTSHNSGACLCVRTLAGVDEASFAFDFVAERSAEGSDPGVCIAESRQVDGEVMAFGRAAAQRVLEMDEAFALAGRAGIALRGLGGTCQGVIGALGSVGQRAEGDSGRFIDLPGLRELPAQVSAESFAALGIVLEHSHPLRPIDGQVYLTLGWVRPTLKGGRPVLPVRWSDQHHAWVPVDQKRSRPLE